MVTVSSYSWSTPKTASMYNTYDVSEVDYTHVFRWGWHVITFAPVLLDPVPLCSQFNRHDTQNVGCVPACKWPVTATVILVLVSWTLPIVVDICNTHDVSEVGLTSTFRWSPMTGFHKNCFSDTSEHCQTFWVSDYRSKTMFRKPISLPSSGDLTTRVTFHISLTLDIAHCLVHRPICFKRLETCVFRALSPTARTCVCVCARARVHLFFFLRVIYK